ncbi:type II toxin-antitoxin system VapC family toxin [Chelatococcus sp. SYSU_G07232]|uniref:Type II toxin-antitoxin system VapC family toxin n=1 Tax=Chelatococcus albus TaxID=3047466 RepID=A0ABT7AIR0_9HYPH|nr:type II toxin-antitoxin system VapC family toxin [Chelatococcus sp. SYSU_G07232]MDJ1158980.1 type II toxin-antitoxin system VapC family toxin [Chelatococcus sp. SYSU_G07232]
MIGLDTNVLLRALTNDDPARSPAAARLLAGLSADAPGFVNVVVLIELAWSLQRRYKAGRADVIAAVEALLESPGYVIADRDAVIDGLEIMKAERLDFTDALIAALNRRAGCEGTFTFDETARRNRLYRPV